MRQRAALLLLLLAVGCQPQKDPTAWLAPSTAPQGGGPGVDLHLRRKGDFLPAVLNVWVEDAAQAHVRTLATYDVNAYGYPSNPYSCYLVACPCDLSCGPAGNAELSAYWPRFWPKSNYGEKVDAASHATSSYSGDTDLLFHWDWKDSSGAVAPNGSYTLWAELSSYPYGGAPTQAPQAHVVVSKNGGGGSAPGTVDQGSGLLSISADWQP